MDDAQKVHLVVLQGGRTGGGIPPGERALARRAFRVIPGGLAGGVAAAIEEAAQAARRMRQDIEERIARELEELF